MKEWLVDNKTEYGFIASDLCSQDIHSFTIPSQIRDEIPTLNKFGYMKADIDYYGHKFIEFATQVNDMTLELGAAYGRVTIEALKKGAKIIANDISFEHLQVLLNNTPKDHLYKLHLYPAEFPNGIDLPSNSLGAVYTSRMLHFLEGDKIVKGLKKINDWLMIQGKLFLVVVTPYHSAFKEKFLHIYEQRQNNNEAWPGRIENQWEIAPEHEEYVPQFLQVFDIPQLEKLLPECGFEIEQISLFDYPNDVDSQGKGHVGLVAKKIK